MKPSMQTHDFSLKANRVKLPRRQTCPHGKSSVCAILEFHESYDGSSTVSLTGISSTQVEFVFSVEVHVVPLCGYSVPVPALRT